MKELFLSLVIMMVVAMTLIGCNGTTPTTGECEKSISEFTLGPSAAEATRYWACSVGGTNLYGLDIYDDGTGEMAFEPEGADPYLVDFTYEQKSCQPVEIETERDESVTFSNMSGSYASEEWSFHQAGDFGEYDVTCILGHFIM